ncbi:MAG: molybdenum cofactor guanylyltransferase [Solirubrobacteraceae bacterium]|nr:molybdenum cofactor guanylyltransferase [Solirubrobacteraceae bacterium]
MPTAAIVLAGGRSLRMGTPKADLDWHGCSLLRRAVGIVGRAVDGPVVVVRARDQQLPALPDHVEVTEDERAGRGPLQGISAGLDAIGDRAEIAFVSGVDAPLLHPAFVSHVIGALPEADDVALPRAHGFAHPLAAAYRVAPVALTLKALLERDDLGSAALFQRCAVRELDEAALLADPAVSVFDPALDSLLNLNEPGEYERARARAAPEVTVRRFGRLRIGLDPIGVCAATLGRAAGAAGVTLGGDVVAMLNGAVAADPCEPLVAGDAVTFLAPERRTQPEQLE